MDSASYHAPAGALRADKAEMILYHFLLATCSTSNARGASPQALSQPSIASHSTGLPSRNVVSVHNIERIDFSSNSEIGIFSYAQSRPGIRQVHADQDFNSEWACRCSTMRLTQL